MKFQSRVLACVALALVSIVVVWRLGSNSAARSAALRAPVAAINGQQQAAQMAVPNEVPASTDDIVCEDPVWCSVSMPSKSLLRFPPPTDARRWRKAQAEAASGAPSLLKRILPHFPNHLDFLDGDVTFRRYNLPADYFLDRNQDFRVVASSLRQTPQTKERHVYDWEKRHHDSVLPPQYDVFSTGRAPVIKAGYFAFSREGSHESTSNYFMGPRIGEAVVDRALMLELWKPYKHVIDTPFVALHAANENWGLLSSFFPNRTTDWGSCCKGRTLQTLMDFLDHPSTLALIVNQHHNFTHPKLVSAPRGLPLTFPNNPKIVWDSMRQLIGKKKSQNIFLSSSTWGYRPKLIACLRSKFNENDFHSASYSENLQGRLQPEDYYLRMGTSRFGFALPGLGYDTFRLWELLTVGSIPIIEKGVGLDKPLWRLPALLVEDYDLVTPELLRTAYVEAMYRADEFEFERLRQSWWWTFIMNISSSKSSQAVLDKFPLESEDPEFTRPFERFSCPDGGCGKGTKRTPSSYC